MANSKLPRRPMKGVQPSSDAEQYYRLHLRAMVREMAKELYAVITPELKRLKPQYTGDAYTRDSWVDDILAAIRGVASRWVSSAFEAQARRTATRTISMAEADNAAAFDKDIKRAVGVDFNQIVQSRGLQNYLDASIADNVSLIKSVPSDYFQKVENIILDNMRKGFAPTEIAKQLQEHTGVSYRRAKLIARDQMAKINSDLTRQRQKDAGIEFYRSQHANDERVSGKPGGRYANAKISCWAIAERDIGYGKGVYKVDEGATYAGETGLHPGRHHVNCRCVAISLIPQVNYFPKE